MNTAMIMLGSNTNPLINIEIAVSKLVIYFEIISESLPVITEPYGDQFSFDFHNVAIKLRTNNTQEATTAIFKRIEIEMGRKPDSKLTGLIPMDIDLIFWNDNLVHKDYTRYEYVRNCINEIK
jgi:2-amino-4-hydroxy-6-hydroxymethyldihydropteridine diphosphokinase